MTPKTQTDSSPGAITRVPGFRAAGVACGIKSSNRLDLALVTCDRPTMAAAVFTTNAFKSAPVLYDQELLSHSHNTIQAIIINSGNANACTGAGGLHDAGRMARLTEAALELPPDSVFVMSTGVIGRRLPMEEIEAGIRAAAGAQSTPTLEQETLERKQNQLVGKESYLQ